MGSFQWALFVISAFAIFKSGESLRCWTCSSPMDGQCADYFNTTRFARYQSPYQSYGGNQNQIQLTECDQGGTSNFYPSQRNQRAVCMKKKQTTFGQTTYIRQCRFLHADEKVGTCPTETTGQATTIDFCEYCDYDGCNGANTMHTSWCLAALLPLMGILLRKSM